MNRNEQEYYKNIERIAVALEKIANKKKQMKSLAESGPIRVKAANRPKMI